MSERILIVDDDPVQRRLLENMARKFGYEPVVAEGGDAAAALLTGPDGGRIDAVVLDLVMPDLDGLGVLAKMREAGLTIPVIVQTAHGGIDNVVSAMRAGASDFVVKPVGAERLQVSLRNALAASALAGELTRLKRSRSGTLTFKDIITRSARMQAVLRTAEKAAGSNIPVLIEGQSGVGKELIARAIHGSGERRAKPFVAVNCGAIPENLVESILFGHEKGAFTGATERHTGKFVEATGGTLFLDEVGELPPAAQVKLLRAIQEGEVEPVGARKPVKVDVRIISATNRDLIADVKSGRFREDLFYRLHVFPITVPPLRERPEDIPDLVRHFLARFAAEEGKRVTRSAPRRSACLPPAAGPAMSASSRTRCSAPWCWPKATRSASANSRRSPPKWPRQMANPVSRAPAPSESAPMDWELESTSTREPDHIMQPRVASRPSATSLAATAWRCWTRSARSVRWRRSKPRSSASPSPTTADRCPRSPGDCGSAARRSTASSTNSKASSISPIPTPPRCRAGNTCVVSR